MRKEGDGGLGGDWQGEWSQRHIPQSQSQIESAGKLALELVPVRVLQHGSGVGDVFGNEIQGPTVHVGADLEHTMPTGRATCSHVVHVLTPAQFVRAVAGAQKHSRLIIYLNPQSSI